MSPTSASTLAVVTRPGAGLGFRLAGVRVEEVEPGTEGERVASLFDDAAIGLLVIDEKVLQLVPEHILERAARRGLPVLFALELPQRWREPGRAEAYVGMLVQRAIGYHVRVQP